MNRTWNKFFGGDGGDCVVNWKNPNIYYAQDAINGGLRRCYNVTSKSLGAFGEPFIGNTFMLNPENPYEFYAGRGKDNTGRAVLNKWIDSDTGISQYPDDTIHLPSEVERVGAIGILNDSIFYIAEFYEKGDSVPNKFVRTNNGGTSWIDLSANPVSYHNWSGNADTSYLGVLIGYKRISSIEINHDNPDEMWVTISGLKRDYNGNGILRVLHSLDGGNSWVDYSEGLSVFPCNTIEYVQGSDGLVFVGTDIGVFYRDSTMSQWECFSDGLPVCIVTELELNTSTNVLYASTFGRGVWKTDLPCDNGLQTLYISSDTTWNSNKRVIKNVTIEQGATLTVTNKSIISMGGDNRITIEPGGKLILEDTSMITSAGCCLWYGIIVKGDHTKSQTPESNQGVLEVSSGGTISNAKFAANVFGTTGFVNGGGIIRVNDAVFRNNARSICMWKYRNFVPSSNTTIPNVSYIKNSLFEITDDNCLDTEYPIFIHLWGVDGIKILANTFIDTSSTADPARHADGILSYDASFYVDPVCQDVYTPCSNWKKNHFEGLNYGIRAMNSNPDRTLSVSTAEFKNVYRSIFLNGVSNATVIFNDFEVPDINTNYTNTYNEPYSDKEPYGLYMNECNAYTVEENVFESSSSAGYDKETYGVIVNNSHEPYNEIYNNDFDDFECGILGVNDNRSISGLAQFSGLKLKCNDLTSTYKDIDLRSSSPYAYTAKGLSEYQGFDGGSDPEAPAGNRFSQNCSPGYLLADFDNELGQNIQYYHHQGDAANGDEWVPKCYSDNILLVSVPAIFDSLACPSNFNNGSGGLSISELYSELDTALQQMNSSFLIYNIWKDGGDTEELELDVELALPAESYELYNELIGESPYLSDDVLIAAIENEEVLTSLMIKLIMIANPQSTRSEDVMDALYSRTNPLPESWIDEIISGTAYASQLEKLEAEYSHDSHEYKMIINDLKSMFLQDTIFSWKKDSLFNLLSMQDDLYSKYELAYFRLKNADTTTMYNILDNIPYIYDLHDEQEANYEDYFEILNIFKTMQSDSINIFDLDSITVDTLESIASTCLHYPLAWANSILEQIRDDIEERYREEIPDAQGGDQRMEAPYRYVAPKEEYSQLKVYPNPATDYFALEYNVRKSYFELSVVIVDITGKKVY